MIDLRDEQLVSLREVPKLLPRRPNGKHIHVSAIYRWVNRGVRGIRLEMIKVGGTTYTSREALQRFADQQRCTGNDHARTPLKHREREIQRAAQQAKRLVGGNT